MLALILQIWPFKDGLTSRKSALIIVLTLILGAVVLLVLVPASMTKGDPFTVAVSLAYPLLDVLLLVIALPSLFFFTRSTFWKPMLLVIIAIVFMLLGDISFSLAVLKGVYYNGHPPELLFDWAFLAFAYGCYLQLKRG